MSINQQIYSDLRNSELTIHLSTLVHSKSLPTLVVVTDDLEWFKFNSYKKYMYNLTSMCKNTYTFKLDYNF